MSEKKKVEFTTEAGQGRPSGFIEVVFDPSDQTLEIRSWAQLRIIPHAANKITVYEIRRGKND